MLGKYELFILGNFIWQYLLKSKPVYILFCREMKNQSYKQKTEVASVNDEGKNCNRISGHSFCTPVASH